MLLSRSEKITPALIRWEGASIELAKSGERESKRLDRGKAAVSAARARATEIAQQISRPKLRPTGVPRDPDHGNGKEENSSPQAETSGFLGRDCLAPF
jgi:hypothetical protein